MADEARSTIVLLVGTVESTESALDLEHRFSLAGASAFVLVEDTEGRKHWLNINHVVEIREHGNRLGRNS
jgi:hypothetical protein